MMKEKKEMTLGELIYSEQFQSRLDERIKECFGEYDKAVEKLKRERPTEAQSSGSASRTWRR